MISLLFIILMICVFGKLAIFALKAAWGVTRVIVTIVLFPAILVILAISGCMAIALPILIIAAIVLLIKKLTLGV